MEGVEPQGRDVMELTQVPFLFCSRADPRQDISLRESFPLRHLGLFLFQLLSHTDSGKGTRQKSQ